MPERLAWPVAVMFGCALWYFSHNPMLWAQYFNEPVVVAVDERTVMIEETNFNADGETVAVHTRKITRDSSGNIGIVSTFRNLEDPAAMRSGQGRLRIINGEVMARAVTGPEEGRIRATPVSDSPDNKRLGAETSLALNVSHCQGGVERTIKGLVAYGPTKYEALIGGPDADPRRRQRFLNVFRAPALGCFAVIRDVDTEFEEGVFRRTEERRLRAASRSVRPELLRP